ncbi:MAG TPA: hypothetical protein VGR35_02215 [Tepidisphaeraceae bacterium]|nr:hypothetical protein [Tepidisphaeraceae bacterium]
MTKVYFILSVAGWVWLVIVAIFLVIRFTIMKRHTRGFDVIETRRGDVPAQGGGNGR